MKKSSSGLIEEFRNQIKSLYRENDTLLHPIFGHEQLAQPLASCFVNVALVKEEERGNQSPGTHNQSADGTQHFHDARLPSYENIFNIKEPFSLEKLFNNTSHRQNNPPKRVVIAGQAGIGKSVLCQYLAYAWATHNLPLPQSLTTAQARLLTAVRCSLQHFSYVFIIRLRNINLNQLDPKKPWRSLIEVMLFQCLSAYDFGEYIEQIDSLLLTLKVDQNRILWLLDGYDEIATDLRDEKNQATPLKGLLDYLTDKKAPWTVVTTSRPIASQELKGDCHLEIMGFLDPQIEEFVQQKINNRDHFHRCFTFLKSSPSVWGTAHIPLNLTLLTELFQHDPSSLEVANYTLTRLYDQIIIHLARKYLQNRHHKPLSSQQVQQLSNKEVLQECQNILLFLEKLARKSLMGTHSSASIILTQSFVAKHKDKQNTIIAKECSTIPQFLDLEEVCRLGLLHPTSRTKLTSETDFYFSHLTFQEYFAARALARSLWTVNKDCFKTLSLVNTEKYSPQCYIIMQFLAGILHTPQPTTELYLTKLKRQRAIRGFWTAIDQLPRALHPLHHRCLLVRLLDEISDDNSESENAYFIRDKCSFIQTGVRCITTEGKYNWSTESDHYIRHPLYILLKRHRNRIHQLMLLEQLIPRLNDISNWYQHIDLKELSEFAPYLGPHIDTVVEKQVELLIQQKTFGDGEVNNLLNLAPHLGKKIEFVVKSLVSVMNYSSQRSMGGTNYSLVINALRDLSPFMDISPEGFLIQLEQKVNDDIELVTYIAASFKHLAPYLGKHASSIIDFFIGLMKKANHNKVFSIAADSVSDLGPYLGTHLGAVTTTLLEQLKKDNEKVKIKACQTLGALGHYLGTDIERVVNALIERLRTDKTIGVRYEAISTLNVLAPYLTTHVATVINALGEQLKADNDPHGKIAETFCTFGPYLRLEIASIVNLLIENFKRSNNKYVRRTIATTLGAYGPYLDIHIDTVLNFLLEHFEKEYHRTYDAALSSIAPFAGPRLNTHLNRLIRQLNEDDANWKTACNAIVAFRSCLGIHIESVVNALRKRMFDEIGHHNRIRAIYTLEELAPQLGEFLEPLVSDLILLMTNENYINERENVIRALGTLGVYLGTYIYPIVSALVECIDSDPDVKIKDRIIDTFRALAPNLSMTIHCVVPSLTKLILDENNSQLLRSAAIGCIHTFGPHLGSYIDSVILTIFQFTTNIVYEYSSSEPFFPLSSLSPYHLAHHFSNYSKNPSEKLSLTLTRAFKDYPLSLCHIRSLWTISSYGLRCYQPSPLFYAWSSSAAFKNGSRWLIEQIKAYSATLDPNYCPPNYFDCLHLKASTLLHAVKQFTNTQAVTTNLSAGWFREQRHSTFGFKFTAEAVSKIFGHLDLTSLFAASFVCKAWHVALHYHPRYCLFSTQFKESYVDCVLLQDETLPAYEQLTPPIPVRTILFFAASSFNIDEPLDHQKEIVPLTKLFDQQKYFKLISNLDPTEPATQASLTEDVIPGSFQQLKNILHYCTTQQQPVWMIHLSMHGRIKDDHSDNELCFIIPSGEEEGKEDWVDSKTLNEAITACHPVTLSLILISACASQRKILANTMTCAEQVMGIDDHEPEFDHAIRWAWEFYQLLSHQTKPVQIDPTTLQEDINNRSKNGLLQQCKLQFFCAPTSRTIGPTFANNYDEQQFEDLTASVTAAKNSVLISMSGK